MGFDINKALLNDLDWEFAFEIVVRTFIMFTLILVVLRLSGKKGVRQLSLFEVAIIIGLGSAAGDPMFNRENAIVPAVIVFITILFFYRFLTWLAVKSERFEGILEGEAMYVVEDGMFIVLEQNQHTFAKDEFFSEMRQQNIEHLGQVRVAILETNGNLSFYYFSDEDVRPGLPVLPKVYKQRSSTVPESGNYACTYCGKVEYITASAHECPRCKHCEWVKAVNTIRIS